MEKIWFTADPHFEHDPIRVFCKRPFPDLATMHAKIIENWNSVVGKKDLVYILGDWAYKNHGKYVMALRGKKVLITGNHDDMSEVQYRNFTQVTPLKDIKIFGTKISLCHYPMMSWKDSMSGAWHLYGHTHGRTPHPGLAMDVGMDTNNFFPYSYEEIRERMAQKYIELAKKKYILYKSLNPQGGIAIIGYVISPEKVVTLEVMRVQGYVESSTTVCTVQEDINGRYFRYMDYNNYLKDFIGYEKFKG